MSGVVRTKRRSLAGACVGQTVHGVSRLLLNDNPSVTYILLFLSHDSSLSRGYCKLDSATTRTRTSFVPVRCTSFMVDFRFNFL